MEKRVLALLDESAGSSAVLAHAVSVARVLRAPVTLVRSLAASACDRRAPFDAVDWSLRRRRALQELENDAAIARQLGLEVDTAVLPDPGEAAATRLFDVEAVQLAVLAGGSPGSGPRHAVLDAASRTGTSLLLVPDGVECAFRPYRRILAALDCSSRSACVLPLIATLAGTTGAEIVLAHVVPVPEMPRLNVPFTAEERALLDAVVRRNERVARTHLQRVGAELASRGIKSRARIVVSGQMGPSLEGLVREERPDLVVIGARGTGGDECPSGWPYGTVAHALMTHLAAPLLVHRTETAVRSLGDLRVPALRHALNVPRFPLSV